MKQVLITALLVSCSIFNKTSAQLLAGLNIAQAEDAPIRTNLVVKTIKLENGITLEYAEQGATDGTPVIFLHGIGDSWLSFESVLTRLPTDIRAFAVSQRGHGNSDRPREDYTPASFARDIAEFIKAKNLASAFIIGHSMGGMIAQQFAINYPALTRAVVIIDSDANFKDNPGFPEFYNTVLKMQGAFDRSFIEEFQRSTIFKPIDAAYFKKLVDESMKVPLQVFKAACTGLANSDLSVKIQQIKVPAMIMWGDKDNVCSLADQQALAKKILHSKLIVYENTGHALHWENPDRFTRDVHLFILQCSKTTR